MKFTRILASAFAAFALLAAAAYATPGPQRMIVPTLYGLSEIADDIYTDDPAKAGIEIMLVSRANANVKGFFGTLEARPRYIICTTMMCEKTFSKNNRIAVTYGWHAIHLPPRAIADPHLGEILLTHERTHSELHKRWGASELWDAKFPTWFDEGLATWVSKDDRVRLDHPPADLEWISHAKRLYNWGSFIGQRGWADAYGAAGSYVALIADRKGVAGLHALIDRTLKGEAFDKVLKELLRDQS